MGDSRGVFVYEEVGDGGVAAADGDVGLASAGNSLSYGIDVYGVGAGK